uniref:ANF_receptor domain-containing protein n=1 Tax=Caenorhabditis tropicalis TaxID=1561998 RepID=A0A1I7THQ5_9PELO
MLRWLTLLSCILLLTNANFVEDVGAANQPHHPPPPPPFPFNVIVILPKRESIYDNFGMTLQKAMPVIDIAVQEVVKSEKLPPGWINLTYWDSKLYEDILLAERHATVGVIQAYCEHRLDAILGFADNYGLATVTKVTAGLNGGIPILTTSGMPSLLNSKKEYPFLTRMQGSYRLLADSMYQLIAYHDDDSVAQANSSLNYLNLIFFYHDKRRAVNRVINQDESQETGATSSHCYFSLYAIKRYFTEKSKTFKREWALNTPQFPFDEDLVIERETFKQWLRDISLQSNVGLPTEEGDRGKNPFSLTLAKSRPVFDVALQDVYHLNILPYGAIKVTFENSALSDAVGPQKMIEHYCNKTVDAIMGLPYVYALAPIARISKFWGQGVPVFTTTALVDELGDRNEFPLLTRMMGSYKSLGKLVTRIAERFEWQHYFFMFNDEVARGPRNKGRSECYFSLSAIKNLIMNNKTSTWNVKMFSEFEADRLQYRTLLSEASVMSNLIILCASPDTVREIMLAAHDLGMATSGEYVFINIDVSTGSHAEQPWIRANDTNNEENEKAKEAYRALKTISLRRSDLEEYKNFELRVKERAELKYNYTNITGKDYEMNNFISAFYDAVLLYAIALNETIQSGLDPRNGHNITSRMWGRTFVGITGNVSIDHNGDRYSDYSLLDLDPKQNKFVEVAYYSGASNQLKTVGELHWVGGKPPTDLPICGYDKSKCPGYPLHVYLLMGSALLILVLVGLFIFFWRRYKLEQELAAMSWKIRWEELDGEESQKKEKKKAKKRKNHDGYLPESDPLLRSTSRSSVNSDKFDEESLIPIRFRLRSSSSGTTRKISAMIDRKLSIFTRKKSTPPSESQKNGGLTPNSLQKAENGDCSPINEVQFRLPLNDRRVSSPSSEARKKNSNEEDPENGAKKSLSLKNRKLSFGMVSFKSGSGGSVETIAQNNTQIYTKTAIFKGVVVAIKKLNIDPKKYPRLDLSRAQLMELKR